MIPDFETFCTWMFVIVDDVWQQLAPRFARPGPMPDCSDSELMTLFLVSECLGWDVETEALSQWQAHRDLFPHLPSQSRANRRRRNLRLGFNLVRQVVLRVLDVAQDRQCAMDSLPVPVMAFHTVPTSTARADWQAAGAAFGRVTTKRQTIFGYKLHLLVTLNGVILDFELAPANVADITAGYELLTDHQELVVIGDKAYIGAERAAELHAQTGTVVVTGTRRTQHQQASASVNRLVNHARQIIEVVNSQLSEQFKIERNHAHTFRGLVTRLYTKLAAHTICIYLNRLLGQSDFLCVKRLAFPI
jgi:hypothetical protein